MHDMSDVMHGLFLASFQTREYTLAEKVNLWGGKFAAGVSALWNEQICTDLRTTISSVEVPVYLIHGIYDYTVSYTLARNYIDELNAPMKGFYTFERSAHSPMFEEPDQTMRILREDVLAGTIHLADP